MTHPDTPDVTTSPAAKGEALKAIVRRNTEQVQGQGDFALFDELFADDFVDHTPQPGTTPDKAGVRVLYSRLRDAFPDFRPRFIGKPSTATSSPHTRSTTAPIAATFSASPRPVRPSISKRSMRCEFATGDHRPLGGGQPVLGPATTRTTTARLTRTAGQDRVSMVDWRRSPWCQFASRRSDVSSSDPGSVV